LLPQGLASLNEIEDNLIDAIDSAGVGEFDGNEIGPNGSILYMYGPNADELMRVVVPVLRRLGLPSGCSMSIRYGEPGAPETVVMLD